MEQLSRFKRDWEHRAQCSETPGSPLLVAWAELSYLCTGKRNDALMGGIAGSPKDATEHMGSSIRSVQRPVCPWATSVNFPGPAPCQLRFGSNIPALATLMVDTLRSSARCLVTGVGQSPVHTPLLSLSRAFPESLDPALYACSSCTLFFC